MNITPFEMNDFPGVVDLLQRELPADYISEETFERKVLLDPNFRREGAIVARDGERVVGFMLGLTRKHPLEDAPFDGDRGWITLMAVNSECQRQGIGSRMLDMVIGYLKSEGAATILVSPYAPNYFAPGVDEIAYPNAIAFLAKEGFEVAYRPLSMEVSILDLSIPEWIKEKDAKLQGEGILFDIFKIEHILPLLEHLRSEFPGDWQRLMRETILDIMDDESQADRVCLAMKDGRCIGFCHHDGERFGPFGVAASHRGRGVGSVLLSRCLQTMQSKGFYRAWLMWTDDRTATLYSELGFEETRRYSVMKRVISEC